VAPEKALKQIADFSMHRRMVATTFRFWKNYFCCDIFRTQKTTRASFFLPSFYVAANRRGNIEVRSNRDCVECLLYPPKNSINAINKIENAIHVLLHPKKVHARNTGGHDAGRTSVQTAPSGAIRAWWPRATELPVGALFLPVHQDMQLVALFLPSAIASLSLFHWNRTIAASPTTLILGFS